ncbi:MAG: 30S ribosomal protein S5 [Patescibacteria group bacterium]
MYQRRDEDNQYKETVVQIKRVSKKTKGGNSISFTALVVVGDGQGMVGVALGKAKDVSSAIGKGMRLAKKRFGKVALVGQTIAHPIEYKKKGARILLKPAREGSGLVAGGPVRVVADAAGIKDLVAKMLGSRNRNANVWATWEALTGLKARQDDAE